MKRVNCERKPKNGEVPSKQEECSDKSRTVKICKIIVVPMT